MRANLRLPVIQQLLHNTDSKEIVYLGTGKFQTEAVQEQIEMPN
jgi:hypothetical protein